MNDESFIRFESRSSFDFSFAMERLSFGKNELNNCSKWKYFVDISSSIIIGFSSSSVRLRK